MENENDTKSQCDPELPSVGAPHIRQRLYFVADAGCGTSERNAGSILRAKAEIGRENGQLNGNSSVGFTDGRSTHELAKPVSVGRRGRRDGDSPGHGGEIQAEGRGGTRESGSVAVADGGNSGTERLQRSGQHGQQPQDGGIGQLGDSDRARSQRLRADDGTQGRQDSQRPFGLPDGAIWPGPTNGFWRDAEWIYCRDGKWRPVGTIESGAFEMADELAADLGCYRDQSSGHYTISPLIEKGKGRVMRLRGYGNAIVAEVAIAFIESYLELE